MALFIMLILLLVHAPLAFTLSFNLGPESLQPYPSPHPYQFPDAAITVLDSLSNGSRLMFWSDGTTYRVDGPSSLFPSNTPSPLTPVLGAGAKGTYDANGNWFLAAFRVSDGKSLVAFTHVENHGFNCPGSYAEWNAGAVVTSNDDGITWTRAGLAISDPQPCTPTFGGAGYSSVIQSSSFPHNFLAYGGCTGFVSDDAAGASGTWKRWKNGAFTSPGINGSSDCLPGVPSNACCPIVHYNSYLQAYIMIYNTWGHSDTLFVATSVDGINFGPSQLLLQAVTGRSLAYGQIIGQHNNSVAGEVAVLAYAAAPPTGSEPRDFVYRTITWSKNN